MCFDPPYGRNAWRSDSIVRLLASVLTSIHTICADSAIMCCMSFFEVGMLGSKREFEFSLFWTPLLVISSPYAVRSRQAFHQPTCYAYMFHAYRSQSCQFRQAQRTGWLSSDHACGTIYTPANTIVVFFCLALLLRTRAIGLIEIRRR